MTDPPRSLVIVAGGRSRRLGSDKPFVEIGGRSVLLRILHATRRIADVVLSVREVRPFERALRAEGWALSAGDAGTSPDAVRLRDAGGRSLTIVPDTVPDLGPLAGLANGLGAAQAPICVVLAGDLPFVAPALVEGLCEALAGDRGRDAIVPRVGGRAQPLCAAYRRDVRELADRLLAGGADPAGPSPSMMSFLERLRVRYVEADDLPGVTDLEAATRGVDSPDDLAWASRIAARTGR